MNDLEAVRRTLPAALHILIGSAEWTQVIEGMSGAQVFRLYPRSGPEQYLKIAPNNFHDSLLEEKRRLDWLQGRLPVPQVLHFADDGERHYLLLTAVPGLAAHNPRFEKDLERLVQTLATGLRMIHSVDPESCPFDQRLDVKLAEAQRRVDAGLVDQTDFDDERQGRSAADIFEELRAARPQSEDLVFTHGDYCLPNIILDTDSWAISGFIDWGRAGIADRYQDLALASRSLAYNWGAAWVERLLSAYGPERMDQQKIEYYKLLDEFF